MTDGIDSSSPVLIESVLASMGVVPRRATPWAVVLVHFQDARGPFPALDHYEALFSPAGPLSMPERGYNMIDYFTDMSHGRLDLSGTKVFGWYQLPANRADFVDTNAPVPAGKLNRLGLLDLGKATALSNGVPLANFSGVLISTFGQSVTCGFTGAMGAIADQLGLYPSILGQEMGHGYGLQHSRRQGSEDDYQDPWDAMSTDVWRYSSETETREFGWAGPGLNAWNMRSVGWLNEARVWSPMNPRVSWEQTLTLRPLHHREDIRDWLAADLGPFLVELRVSDGWDRGIPRACVLVHRFVDGHSYLQTGTTGRPDLIAGDRFVSWSALATYELEVQELDERNKTAKVYLRCQYNQLPLTPFVTLREALGLLETDGETMILGGRTYTVPTRGAARDLLEQVMRYLNTELSGDVAAGLATRRRILVEVVRAAAALYAEAGDATDPPPKPLEDSEQKNE